VEGPDSLDKSTPSLPVGVSYVKPDIEKMDLKMWEAKLIRRLRQLQNGGARLVIVDFQEHGLSLYTAGKGERLGAVFDET